MRPPDVSVVVVNYNGREVLSDCVASYLAACRRLKGEVLVVDNASSDGSAGTIPPEERVRLIESPVNRGYAGGANLGLAEARGRFLVVSNHDIRVEEDSLEALVDAFERHPRAGLVGPALVGPGGAPHGSVGSFPTLPSVVARRVFEHVGIERLCRDRPAYLRLFGEDRSPGGEGPVDQVSGALLCVRREALDEVGPMDDGFFLFLEETDWCRRMWNAGWEVRLEPRARASHLGSHSTGRLADRAARFESSLVRYLAIHRGRSEALLFRLISALVLTPLSTPRRLYLHAKSRWNRN